MIVSRKGRPTDPIKISLRNRGPRAVAVGPAFDQVLHRVAIRTVVVGYEQLEVPEQVCVRKMKLRLKNVSEVTYNTHECLRRWMGLERH